MRERGGLLAAFLGISAVLYHAGSVTKPAKSSTTAGSTTEMASAEGHLSDWDLLKNFDDFYQLNATPPENSASAGNIRIEKGNGMAFRANFSTSERSPVLSDAWWRDKLNDRFDWMIATVPDPELSGMKLDFDREINSIQNAVESAHYHFDRYFFPWRSDDQAVQAANAVHESTAEREARRELPGMLLFRGSAAVVDEQPGKVKDLVVFLVGETPTSGIVRKQFENAIRFGEFSSRDKEIRIAGPGFSGSFPSLDRLISNDQEHKYRLLTWTSDYTSQREFRNAHSNVEIAAMNDSSFDSLRDFCRYLRGTWQDNSPIVLLVEEGTAFGSGLAASLAQERGDKNSNDKQLQKDLGHIYTVKFPRGISKLRNATESKDQIPGFEPAKQPEILRRELPFTLKEDHPGSSELPFYSKEQSPVSQESVLLGISSLIKKGSLHYAGIIATDPLDLLFLSRFLRSASPNTRLFTLESDLLFEHGTDGADFEGVLAVTNYPLLAFNQIWTRSIESYTMQIFPNAESESIYNSTVGLLPDTAKHRHFREYANPFDGKQPFDFRADDRPPIWLTVAGRDGYAPIARLDVPEVAKSVFLKPMPTDSAFRKAMHVLPQWVPEYWESWGYCFCFIWVLSLAYAAVVLFARPKGNRLFAIFSVKPDEPKPLHRAHFLFLLGLCLSVLVALWLAVPYAILDQNKNYLVDIKNLAHWRASAFAAMVSGMVLVACAALFVRRKYIKSARPAWTAITFAAVSGIMLAWCVPETHPQLNKPLLSLLSCGAILAGFASVPASLMQFIPSRQGIGIRKISLVWKALLLVAALLILLIIITCMPPNSLNGSPSLVRLWALFYAGAVVLGCVIGACIIPVIDAIHGMKRIHRLELEQRPELSRERESLFWASPLLSDIYFWLTLAFGVVGAVELFWTVVKLQDQSGPERFLAACRSINLTSGVSPLMPLTLTVLALAYWSLTQLRRVTYHEDRCPTVPTLPNDVFCPKLRWVVKEIKVRIAADFFHPTYGFVCVVTGVGAVCICLLSEHQTFESKAMDLTMLLFACAVAISLVTACTRFVLIWSAFREFLQQLERHPLREIFSYLPRGFLWAPLWQGGQKKRTHVAITRSLECIHALINNPRTPPALVKVLEGRLPELTRSAKRILKYAAIRKRVSAPDYQRVQAQLGELGTAIATELERNKWPHGSYEARSELASRNTMQQALAVSKGEFELEEPYTIASELLALRFIPFVNYALLQLQNLALYLSTGFLLLLATLHSYVFRARTVIDSLLTVLFLAIGTAIVTVFAQLDRDAVFSRITRTEEGKLDRNFFFHLLSYGGIPTLALLASHVPAVSRFFFSWIKPAMDAIH